MLPWSYSVCVGATVAQKTGQWPSGKGACLISTRYAGSIPACPTVDGEGWGMGPQRTPLAGCGCGVTGVPVCNGRVAKRPKALAWKASWCNSLQSSNLCPSAWSDWIRYRHQVLTPAAGPEPPVAMLESGEWSRGASAPHLEVAHHTPNRR